MSVRDSSPVFRRVAVADSFCPAKLVRYQTIQVERAGGKDAKFGMNQTNRMDVNVTLLAEQPFLAGLPERQLDTLLRDAMPVTFQANDVIFKEGEPANRFYLLLSGEVVLESRYPQRQGGYKSWSVEIIGPGDVLGWSWMFPPYRWHFDARAVSPVKAIFFYGTRLRERCEENHELGFDLMRRFAEVTVRRLQATRLSLLKAKNAPRSL